MMVKAIISLFLIIISVPYSWSIDLSSVNFNYKYEVDAAVRIKYRLQEVDGLYKLIFGVTTISSDTNSIIVRTIFQRGYIDESVALDASDTLAVKEVLTENSFLYEHQFPNDSTKDLLVLVVDHLANGKSYYFDIPVSDQLSLPPVDFNILKDSSHYFKNYFPIGEELDFDRPAVHVYQYNEGYPAALSPMSDKSVGNNLTMDSVYSVDKLQPEVYKLYFIQTDTTSLSGLSLLGVPARYPKFTTITDLVQPLLYISKPSEIEEISQADNPKLSMDRFWLDVTGSKERALAAIRRFFRRVTESNELFTNYKQGWKTDRGMVYIIFGKPHNVSRTAFQETWTYRLSAEELKFTFNRIKNIFSPNHYDLERSEDYQDVWFRQVDLWRKGRI